MKSLLPTEISNVKARAYRRQANVKSMPNVPMPKRIFLKASTCHLKFELHLNFGI
jgi:hypothetical protein